MTESSLARGVVFIHGCPRALCVHLEWSLSDLLGKPVSLEWVNQPVTANGVRSELSWVGQAGLSNQIAAALKHFPDLRFEVTEEPSPGHDGQRIAFTPSLGFWRSPMGSFGESFVPEDKLRITVADALAQGESIPEAIDQVLGGPWDRELEPFRFAGEGMAVRWLHNVV